MSKARPLDFEKKLIAQLRKMFCKIPLNTHAIISVMLLCSFVYAEALFDFEGDQKIVVLENSTKITAKHVCNFIKM